MNPDEILKEIEEMGYVICTPKDIRPSCYRLKDGTNAIVSLLMRANYLIPNSRSPDGFALSSVTHVNVLVPKEHRKSGNFQQFQIGDLRSGIIDDDVKFEVLDEIFNTYSLSNGFKLSVKAVVSQIQKTKFFSEIGEPMYIINSNPIMKMTKTK